MTNYSDMTNEQLDKAVAEKVMGWHIENILNPFHYELLWCTDKVILSKKDYHPSIDILHALEVMNQMIADGWVVNMTGDSLCWWVCFIKDDDMQGESDDKLLSRAICISALRAKESEE